MMRYSGWLQRRIAWLTICAMLFGMAAPSLSAWLAAKRGVTWVEVCTAQGVKRIALASGGKTSPVMHELHDGFCGYCHLQQHTPALPTPATLSAMAALGSAHLTARLGKSSVERRLVHEPYITRGPPAFS